MPYCSNCGHETLENSKFCSNCGSPVTNNIVNENHSWSLTDFLEENPPNSNGVILCPRCLGKGNVDEEDIYRLEQKDFLLPGECNYCEGVGKINIKKLEKEPFNGRTKESSIVPTDKSENAPTVKTELLTASIFDGENKLKFGKINIKGEWVIQPIFDWLDHFDKYGFYKVEINQKYGYVDSKGNWVIPAKYDLKIYNRWGELIFETENFDLGWNGIYKNHHAEPGLYIYLAQFSFGNEDLIEKAGSVYLFR